MQLLHPGGLDIISKVGRISGGCPLKNTKVEAEISGFIARVDVIQEFSNPTKDTIEAIYTFPLPEDSAVDEMEMKVGDRVIVGEIHKRDEARAIYEAARQAGQVASLLDQERSNIFTQSIANITPGAVIKIRISYTQILKYEAGDYQFVFPMVVGPRYIPGNQSKSASGTGWSNDTDQVPDASRITPPVTPKGTRAGHDISIRVKIDACIPINTLECKSHDVDVKYPDDSSADVILRNKTTIPNKDFVLFYNVSAETVGSGVLTSAPWSNGGYFTMIMQPPKSPKAETITPKEMMFVIDISGSQMGEPLAKSKETMLHCIKNLNHGDTFNMISFSNGVNKLYDKSKPFTENSLNDAIKYLKDCEAGGGTEMMPAIKTALEPDTDSNRLRIVVFFTDGYIGNDFEIVDYIQKNIGDSRIFSFGIGNSVNRFLVEKMAEEGRGGSEVVLLNSDSQEIAEKFYNRIKNPILTDIQIDWNGLSVIEDEVYPKHIPDLFSSQPLILKGRYSDADSGEIIVHAKLNGKPWVKRISVDFPKSEPYNDALLSIWARAKVEDLMSQDWMGSQTGEMKTPLKEQIIDTALEYKLMTQYTSFVAVEKRVVTSGGKTRTIVVPVEMPDGVSYEGIFGESVKMSYLPASAPGAVGGGYGAGGTRGKFNASTNYAAPSPTLNGPNLYREEIGINDQNVATQKDKELSKLDKTLQDLISKYHITGKTGKYSIPNKLETKNGMVEVMIQIGDAPKDALAQLKKLGLKDDSWISKDSILIGWVSIEKLREIAKLEFVLRISPPIYAGK